MWYTSRYFYILILAVLLAPIILKKDLELALKRIDDFHSAISSEIDSDSDTITFSDEEFLETLSQSRQSSIRDSIAQEISDLSSKKV